MDTLPNTVGVFLVLELFAVPFGYEGASAIMNQQWGRAFTAYLIAVPIAVGGLLVIGVPILGKNLTGSIGSVLAAFLSPLSSPYFVVLILIGVLFWLRSTANTSPKIVSESPSPEASKNNIAGKPTFIATIGALDKPEPNNIKEPSIETSVETTNISRASLQSWIR